jgi:galactokinase
LSSTPNKQGQSRALPPDGARQFRAPARVNLIGEHTDYNDGLVLPTTTALFTSVTATPRADRIVKVTSGQMQDTQGFDLDDVELVEKPQWIDYAKGVAAEIEMEGVRLLGADLHIESDIPLGGGLSSSASFELAIATALLEISAASLSGPAIAKLCQRAENRYAGVSCGIMDQYVIACCEANMAMLLDCRTLHTEQVAIPADLRLLITDSGFKHNLPVSGYNNRLGECALACRILAQDVPEVTALRDLSMDSLESRRGQLDDLLYRRCRHVVSEIQRVRDAFAALQTGDLDRLGNLISASHTSLRDDYDVSRDEVDQLVEIADGSSGVLGSRMVGAGFGGCVLSLVEADKIDEAAREVRQKYGELTGDEPWMHIVQAAPPAREVGHLGANEQS